MATYLDNIADWFRKRVDGPGRMATLEDATLGLRILAIWRSWLIGRKLKALYGLKVLAGPFAGMAYVEGASEGALTPRLLGTYESELHPHLEAFAREGADCVIDVGCAEGYYAVGLARLFPNATIYAFDRDPVALELCPQMAKLNGVEDRVVVEGLFTPERFQAFAGRSCVVLMDVEGAEDQLLRPDLAPALAQMRLIVETHEGFSPGVRQRLMDRFSGTHDIVLVESGPKTQPLPDFLNTASQLDQMLAVWEFRGGPTPWLVMTPKPR